MKVIYIAGKYRGDIDANIAIARKVAIELWEMGHAVFCPHLNTQHFEVDCCVPEDAYIQGDLEILKRCDGVVMLPGWRESKGATQEYYAALRAGLPVWFYPSVPEVM